MNAAHTTTWNGPTAADHPDVHRAGRGTRPSDHGKGPRHGRSRTRPADDNRAPERHRYIDLQLASGHRAICRRNNRELDVDNGMPGTIRDLDADHVVIDTDSTLVREASADYAAGGIDDYLSKPARLAALDAAIQRHSLIEALSDVRPSKRRNAIVIGPLRVIPRPTATPTGSDVRRSA
jgi:hypothetical protein